MTPQGICLPVGTLLDLILFLLFPIFPVRIYSLHKYIKSKENIHWLWIKSSIIWLTLQQIPRVQMGENGEEKIRKKENTWPCFCLLGADPTLSRGHRTLFWDQLPSVEILVTWIWQIPKLQEEQVGKDVPSWRLGPTILCGQDRAGVTYRTSGVCG